MHLTANELNTIWGNCILRFSWFNNGCIYDCYSVDSPHCDCYSACDCRDNRTGILIIGVSNAGIRVQCEFFTPGTINDEICELHELLGEAPSEAIEFINDNFLRR